MGMRKASLSLAKKRCTLKGQYSLYKSNATIYVYREQTNDPIHYVGPITDVSYPRILYKCIRYWGS